MTEESIAEDITEEIKFANEEQEYCTHDTIERDANIWVCSDCGLHFKPVDYGEENFLEWAKNQSWIKFGDKAGQTERDNE